MITLDTSAVIALAVHNDRGHAACRAALEADAGPVLLPAALLSEAGYMLGHDLGNAGVDTLLATLESGAFTLDCGENDLARVRTLFGRYADLRLGIADAFVIACAERNGGHVLTTDRRDFDVVAREGTITVLPT